MEKIIVILFGLLIWTSSAGAETAIGADCSCVRVDIFDYPVANINEADFTEDYPWEAFSVSPIPGKTSCRVEIGLVTNDHPGLQTLPDGEYSHLEYILVGRDWIDFDEFEKKLRAQGCLNSTS